MHFDFEFQRRLHAFHMLAMQIRILLWLQQTIQNGRQMWYVRLLCEIGSAFPSSEKLSILFERQRATRTTKITQGSLVLDLHFAVQFLFVRFQLQMNKIEYNLEPLERLRDEDYGEASARARARKLCPMPIQKETPQGLVDTVCNGDVNDNNAGLCRLDSISFFRSILLPATSLRSFIAMAI